jgi:hypothetical protein
MSPGDFAVRTAKTMDYVCVNCGYYERYITNRKVLDRIAEKWERAD